MYAFGLPPLPLPVRTSFMDGPFYAFPSSPTTRTDIICEQYLSKEHLILKWSSWETSSDMQRPFPLQMAPRAADKEARSTRRDFIFQVFSLQEDV